ncbi:hypothetical protein Tco_0092873 [Tanacetum coccineum]
MLHHEENTARPVNTAALKSKVNDAIPKTYSYFKAHSPVRRAFNQKSAAKTYNLNEKVKTARANSVTTVGPKAVVSAAVGYGENVVKSSACWIWRPTRNVIDYTSTDSGSYMFKRSDYVDLQGRLKSVMAWVPKRNQFSYFECRIGWRSLLHLRSPKGVKITEKENSVLFTETKCLVLSPDFKLLNESQVLLKVSRHNNMYSFDLKNVVPCQRWGKAPKASWSGPDWLFDIDLLTNSMNYEPVTARNQTNKIAGIKDNTQQYILLPLLYDSPKSSKDAVDDDAGKKTNEEPTNEGERNGQEKEGGASNKEDDQNMQDFRVALDNLLIQQKKGYTNTTNRYSIVSPSVNIVVQSFTNADDLPIDPLMPDLRTAIFKYWYSLEWPYDRWKMWIIGDINSATQTKRMTKISEKLDMFPDKVYKVEKALYGLHPPQALVPGIENLSNLLFRNGLKKGSLKRLLVIKKTKVISFSTGGFQVTPKVLHLHVVKRIFRYLKGQPKLGLWYLRDSPFDLEAFSDSDYAGASLDRKSTIGGCQFLGKRLISWQCKKKTIVANSTTKAKYVAAVNCRGQVGDEAVHKELGDKMERAATTASNIEAEQDREMETNATIDERVKTVTEASIRRHLMLEDSDGINTLPNTEIFEQLALMGFIQIFLNKHKRQLLPHKRTYIAPTLTQKLFGNMRRISKGYNAVDIPLFPTMLMRMHPQVWMSDIHTNVADEAASTCVDVRHRGVAPTVTSLDARQSSSNINKTPSMPHDSPLLRGYTLGSDEGGIQQNELMDLVTKLSNRCEALETDLRQTKKVYSDALTRLIKKVKKLEKSVKTSQARRRSRVILSDDEAELEYSSKQRRIKVLADVARKRREVVNVQSYTRRRRAVSTGSGEISTAGASMSVSTAGTVQEVNKYKGKGIMTESEPEQIKTKLQQRQERAGYEAAVRLQEQLDEEERQRIARLHEEASSFNIEEWEDIQATIEADEELAQRIQAEEREKYSEAEKARLLAELINQRKRYFS